MARNIGHQHPEMVLIDLNEIKIIATGFGRGLVVGKEIESGNLGEFLANQALLDPGDGIPLPVNDVVSLHQLVIEFFGAQYSLNPGQ